MTLNQTLQYYIAKATGIAYERLRNLTTAEITEGLEETCPRRYRAPILSLPRLSDSKAIDRRLDRI